VSPFDVGPVTIAEPAIVTRVIMGVLVAFAVEVALLSGALGFLFARLLLLCRFEGAR
jgi:hypothetical protein